MGFAPADYPTSIWDGLSPNTQRTARTEDQKPNFKDWDQVVAEMIATQTEVDAVKTTRDTAHINGALAVGAESGDDILVTLTLTDDASVAIATQPVIEIYFSDDSAGEGLAAAGPTSEVATTGKIMLITLADKVWKVEPTVGGIMALTFTNAGAFGPVFLVALMPDGQKVVSAAITFAA